MSPLTHFLGSWLIATATTQSPRDRPLITLAGMLPDLAGLGLWADVAQAAATSGETTYHYYHCFHHLLLHGWPDALLVTTVLASLARDRWHTAGWVFLTFHPYLLCDLLDSRGPSSADLWPICYSEPLFRHPIWIWRGQWKLDSW